MRENNRYILLHKERKRLRMEAKKRDELIAQRTSHEASRLTFKMVVTLKMLARRVRTRSQYRAPLTMSQQRIVADYEEQVYQVRCTTALEQQCRWILVASASVVLGEKAGSVCGLLLWFSDIWLTSQSFLFSFYNIPPPPSLAQLHQTVYEDSGNQDDAEAISLASLKKLEELHMKLMFHILRQLGRGAYIHEKIRVIKTEDWYLKQTVPGYRVLHALLPTHYPPGKK